MAEERLKEYGEFVKTGGYGLEPAGEDERISYSADQNVDIPPSYDWETFDVGGEKQEPVKLFRRRFKKRIFGAEKEAFSCS